MTFEPETCTVETPGLTFSCLRAGTGPLVLVLHGFPDHAPSFRPLLVVLAQAGFTAVAPYLRGYAPSGPAPDGRYDFAALGHDVPALVAGLGFTRAHVVGHDLGAVMGYCAAIQAPSCVASLVAMSVPPLRRFLSGLLTTPAQLRRSAYIPRLQLGAKLGGGVAWLSANDFAAIDLLWSRWSPGWVPDPELIAAVKHTFRQPGTATAAVAYYRQMLPNSVIGLGEYARIFRTLVAGTPGCPTLILAGREDGCIGRELYTDVETMFQEPCSLEIVADAGHFLHLERPEWVHAAIKEHLATSAN